MRERNLVIGIGGAILLGILAAILALRGNGPVAMPGAFLVLLNV